MAEAEDDYDFFIYAENDLLITEQNLLAFCETTEKLPEPFVVGFIRYERNRKNPADGEEPCRVR